MRIVRRLVAAASVAVLGAALITPTATTANWKSETTFGAQLRVASAEVPVTRNELPPYPNEGTSIANRVWTIQGSNAASGACVQFDVTQVGTNDTWSVYFSKDEAPLWGTPNQYWIVDNPGDMKMELTDDRLTVTGTTLPKLGNQFCMVSSSNPPPSPRWEALLTTSNVGEYANGQACMDVTVAAPTGLTATEYPFYFGWNVELTLTELSARFPDDVEPSRLSSDKAWSTFLFAPWAAGDPSVQLVSAMGGALRVGDQGTPSHDLQICLHQW